MQEARTPSGSELSLVREKKIEDDDPLSSNYPKWSSRIKCLQAHVTVIISLSSVLEFGRSLGTNGLVALIPFVLFRIIASGPLLFIDIMLGRYTMGNVAQIWCMCPMAKGILYCVIIVSCFMIVLNNVSSAYVFKYMFACLRTSLPWESCEGRWAEINCMAYGKTAAALLKCRERYTTSYCANLTWETPGLQYWVNVAGNQQNVMFMLFSFVNLMLTIGVVIAIAYKGIRSLEKSFVFLLYVPLFLASIIAFVTFLVPGATYGLQKIWFVDIHKLADVGLWIRSFHDSLLALGLGVLSVNFVSTHGKFFDNIFTDILVVTFAEAFCCALVITPILSIIKSMNYNYPEEPHIGDFNDNLGLFIRISEALVLYPYPNALWAFAFYLELTVVSLSSQAALVIAICESIMGIFENLTNYLLLCCIVSIITLAVSAPFLFVTYTFENYLATSTVTIIFLFVFTLEVFYGIERYVDDFHFMMGFPPSMFTQACWNLSLLFIFVCLGAQMYFQIPSKPTPYMVYIYIGLPVSIYIISGIWQIYKASKHGRVVDAFGPNLEWGPDNTLLKKSRIIFNSRDVTKEFMYRQELYKKTFIKPVDFTEQNIVQVI